MNTTDRMIQLVLARRPDVSLRGVKREIADTCGVSYQAVRQWFSGSTGSIKNENLMAVAHGFDTTVDWLLMGNGEPPRRMSADDAQSFPDKAGDDLDSSLHGPYGHSLPKEIVALLPKGRAEAARLVGMGADALREAGVAFSREGNLAIINAFGESMARTFTSGDLLIVDCGVRHAAADGVYVFTLDGTLSIKRLQRLPKALRMISDDEHFPPYDIQGVELDALKVHGRVLLAWNVRKL